MQGIELHTQALTIARDTGNRYLESSGLNNLGICHYRLGDYMQAIERLTQAVAIARDIGNIRLETIVLGTWGSVTDSSVTTGRPSTCTPKGSP